MRPPHGLAHNANAEFFVDTKRCILRGDLLYDLDIWPACVWCASNKLYAGEGQCTAALCAPRTRYQGPVVSRQHDITFSWMTKPITMYLSSIGSRGAKGAVGSSSGLQRHLRSGRCLSSKASFRVAVGSALLCPWSLSRPEKPLWRSSLDVPLYWLRVDSPRPSCGSKTRRRLQTQALLAPRDLASPPRR